MPDARSERPSDRAGDVAVTKLDDNGRNELVEALATAHRQVDMLMAMVITLDNSFMPSKTSLWPDIVKRVELIKKYGGSL